jgi:putative membrane protein
MMWDAGMWGWGLLWMLLFWGLVIAGIVWLVRTAADGRDRGRRLDTARTVLDERLARGEMSVEEYEERRRVLSDRR